MTRIVAISDTHGLHKKLTIPICDLLVHCGDFTGVTPETPKEALKWLSGFVEWLDAQHAAVKVFIAGNHDMVFEAHNAEARKIVASSKSCIYLQDESVTLFGMDIYGSPWTPDFGDWHFTAKRGMPMAEKWANIPNTTDLLITHGPPYGILDPTDEGSQGCRELYAALTRVLPSYHLFGHIHGGYGETSYEETYFVNCSVVNEQYRLVNKPKYLPITNENMCAAKAF
jgi:Icc-related predicted phosphoesterase